MSRLELLYTCVANLAKFMHKSEDGAFPKSLIHYTEEDDHNRVLYHNRSEDTESKITQVLKDAARIITACGSRYDESSDYQLLIRVIEEQTDKEPDGNLILKSGKSDMNSELLQNPADPDATFRAKAGKDYRGYIANVVETADKNNSIVVDYQFEKNIYSDSQFVKDYLDKQPVSEEETILVTDGGYCGYENVKQAAEKMYILSQQISRALMWQISMQILNSQRMERKSFPALQVIDPKAMYMTSIHKNAKHPFR